MRARNRKGIIRNTRLLICDTSVQKLFPAATLKRIFRQPDNALPYSTLSRQVIGVKNRFNDSKTYGLQALKDNVSLLDEETVNQVNAIVVEAAHRFVLKKAKRSHFMISIFRSKGMRTTIYFII